MQTDNKKKVEEISANLKSQSEQTENRLDQLWTKLEEGDYMKQGYPAGSQITISGDLFQSFITTIANTKYVIDSIKDNFNITMDGLLLEQHKMTVHLMEQHVKNVDEGLTIHEDELDMQDAKEKIKPVKDGKK